MSLGANTCSGVGSVHRADTLGEIRFCDFSVADCAILSQTFFTAFARAAVAQRLWAGEEFWFFSLGAILWLIAFLGLPRPILIYVFGHELTHCALGLVDGWTRQPVSRWP